MAHTLTAYRVFIASPGGLEAERKAFRQAINDYNEIDAISRGVMFLPIGWEQTLPGMGRPQAIINEDLRDCDYFLLMLWDRWGSPSGDEAYTSATSEEYSIAHTCWQDPKHSLREIAAFFKAVEPRQMSDPGAQLKNVLDFRRQLEQTKELLFGTFDDTGAFHGQVQRLLAKWVRDHEQGLKPKVARNAKTAAATSLSAETSTTPLTPATSETAGLRGLDKSKGVIEEAEKLASAGRLTDAESLFARALAKDNDPETSIQYARFLRRLGRFSQAQALLEGILERTTPAEDHWKAGAYNYLGMLHRDRGELEEAEKMLEKARSFEANPAARETTIAAYNNLGQVYRDRGDLARALEMHESALKLCKEEGDEASRGSALGNLAHVYLIKGDLEKAAAANEQSIALTEKIGNNEGLAISLRNQGLIFIRQGKLDEGGAALHRSLQLATMLGRQKSMADAYSGLAQLKIAQGDYKVAEKLITDAIETNQRIGRKKGVARALSLLGETQYLSGNGVEAEQALLRAIEAARAIGDQTCMANSYKALGSLFQQRGQATAATLLWRDARGMFERIGIPGKVRELDALLCPESAATATGR